MAPTRTEPLTVRCCSSSTSWWQTLIEIFVAVATAGAAVAAALAARSSNQLVKVEVERREREREQEARAEIVASYRTAPKPRSMRPTPAMTSPTRTWLHI